MGPNLRRGFSLAVLALLIAGTAAIAQTTGRIQGRVTASDGSPLPGVTVRATSPNLQGERLAVTDEQGAFRLLNLSPGEYTVSATLDGFNALEQQNVTVGLDRTVTLELAMSEAFEEAINVLDQAPVIDITSPSTGVSVTAETFNQIPLARDFYAVSQVAAGTGEDDYGTTVGGSTSAENQYVIDGLNTTGVELGVEGKSLNFEFIQEVETKTGALPAEYGRLTGGFVNAITKSGGNDVHGDVFGYFEGGSLQEDDATQPDRPETTTTVANVDSRQDYGVDVGGYFLKDKLWYFAAYDRVDQTDEYEVIRFIESPGSPAPGSVVSADTTRDLYAGKLTWRINTSNNLNLSLFSDPSTREGNIIGTGAGNNPYPVAGPPITWDGVRDTGSDDYVARYDGVFGGRVVLEALAGKHQEEDRITGDGKDSPQFSDNTVVPVALSNGFGFHQDQEFERDVYKADLSAFFGQHEFKVGGDIEDVSGVNDNWNGGAGQRIFNFEVDGVDWYRHRYYVDDLAPGFNPDLPETWVLLAPQTSEPESENTSLYAQDKWQIASNFTLTFGARLERQEVIGRGGVTAFEIDDNLSPRVGFTWDTQKNGRSKLYANYGRYYESIPMDINIRAFGGEVTCFCNNFDPDPDAIQPLDDPLLPNSALLGGSTTPVDPGLKGQYIDEYLLGYEYEVRPDFALGVQFSYRDLGRVIEDFLVIEEGNYFIANPGEGQFGQSLTFYDYSTVPSPQAKREYSAFELSARKRFSDNWQLIANYVYSELEGNYDGTFQSSTGQLDPNINSAFDYADFLINADGKLTNEREHQIKVSGNYRLSSGWAEGLNIGARAFWLSGTPLTGFGYSFLYGNHEYYLTPRGSLGNGPDFYEADLHVSYPFQISDRVELNLLMDVFNLLDRQAIIELDQRYNLSSDGRCAGIPIENCNGDNGLLHQPNSLEPVAQLADPRATATNPDFLRKGVGFSDQRSIRLGVRLSF